MHTVTRLHSVGNLCTKVCLARLAQYFLLKILWYVLREKYEKKYKKRFDCGAELPNFVQEHHTQSLKSIRIWISWRFLNYVYVWCGCRCMLCSGLESVLPVCWNGGVQLKGTMWWIYFIMNKAFVWGAHILNGGPESRSSFELSGQRHHRTDALFHIHLVPHTGGPSHLSFWLSSDFFKGLAGTIGHLEAFMWRKTNVVFLFLLLTLGEELHRGEGFHLLPWLPATVKNNNFVVVHQIKTTDYIKKNKHFNWNTEKALHVSIEKVGTDMKSTAIKYAKQAHHRE